MWTSSHRTVREKSAEAAISSAEGKSTTERQGKISSWKPVETVELVQEFLDTMLGMQQLKLYVDLEGVNLSRRGSISLIRMYTPSVHCVYNIDINILGDTASSTKSSNETTLKAILEFNTIVKCFFDVRNDSDVLYNLFGIRLADIQDIQLMELALRAGSKTHLTGLAKCIEKDCGLSLTETPGFQRTKKTVISMFSPEHGGSYEVFNTRPLPPAIVEYCIQDVQHLPRLVSSYETRFTPVWASNIYYETHQRLLQSWSPKYRPQGQHKKLGHSPGGNSATVEIA